jgi:hypothetical protein
MMAKLNSSLSLVKLGSVQKDSRVNVPWCSNDAASSGACRLARFADVGQPEIRQFGIACTTHIIQGWDRVTTLKQLQNNLPDESMSTLSGV